MSRKTPRKRETVSCSARREKTVTHFGGVRCQTSWEIPSLASTKIPRTCKRLGTCHAVPPASAKHYRAPRVERRQLRISEGCTVRRPRRFLHFQARRYAEDVNGSGHVAQDPPQARNAATLRTSREDSYAIRTSAL